MINLSCLKGYKIGVFGLGKSGKATVAALQKAGALVIAYDDSVILDKDDYIVPIDQKIWTEIHFLILSPGISLAHPIAKLAYSNNIKIIGDIELLYKARNQATFIGITGTNGKSTTTSLIGHIIKTINPTAEIGGNIGVPVLSLKEVDCYILELSSFQLELIDSLRFNIAVILNITKDHLDRHLSMENYIQAKINIIKNKPDYLIINIDNDITKKIAEEFAGKMKIIPISTEIKLEEGISFLDDNIIYHNNKPIEIGVLKYLPGKHNRENIAASFAAALAYNVPIDNIISALYTFKGLEHRAELVSTYKNLTFINDSKATNAEASKGALLAFDNIYWIVGGVPKEGGIDQLIPLFGKVKEAFLIGKSSKEFGEVCLKNNLAHQYCDNLKNAFKLASMNALKTHEDAVILLSPACASYDQWQNFEERGYAFKKLVSDIYIISSV